MSRRLLILNDRDLAALELAVVTIKLARSERGLTDADWRIDRLEGMIARYRAKPATDSHTDIAREAAELVVGSVDRPTSDEIADGVLEALAEVSS